MQKNHINELIYSKWCENLQCQHEMISKYTTSFNNDESAPNTQITISKELFEIDFTKNPIKCMKLRMHFVTEDMCMMRLSSCH
ncbi:unnamed protein product [Moneuplotes crassus]|uniref:Uncharacterized protein n=1 Tax=Euplotes crassus TaxID=5936 RepID=A0AAD1X801_EUPCR|nr:unnamed protein product [Moneuplotes crassus]